MKSNFFTTVLCASLVLCCSCSEDDIKMDDPNAVFQDEETLGQTSSPEEGGKPEYDQSNFGEYVAMVTGGNYVSESDAHYPDHFGMAARLNISVGDNIVARLQVEDETENFTAEATVSEGEAVDNLKFCGDKNSVFWFTVGANGENPSIDSIKITAYGQGSDVPRKWENPLRAAVLKNTSNQPVSVFVGEVILVIGSGHPKVCAIKQGDCCIFDFGGTYRFCDFGSQLFKTELSGNNIYYDDGCGQSIQAGIKDGVVISGDFNSNNGTVSFNLINTSFIAEFKEVLTDPANDNGGACPGSDIQSVKALNTKNYLSLQVLTGGLIKNYLNDCSNGKTPAFAFWTADQDDVFVERHDAFIENYTTPRSFNGTNNYIVRTEKSFFVILDKSWCLDKAKEIEFSLSATYGYMKSHDDTDHVIIKAN